MQTKSQTFQVRVGNAIKTLTVTPVYEIDPAMAAYLKTVKVDAESRRVAKLLASVVGGK